MYRDQGGRGKGMGLNRTGIRHLLFVGHCAGHLYALIHNLQNYLEAWILIFHFTEEGG